MSGCFFGRSFRFFRIDNDHSVEYFRAAVRQRHAVYKDKRHFRFLSFRIGNCLRDTIRLRSGGGGTLRYFRYGIRCTFRQSRGSGYLRIRRRYFRLRFGRVRALDAFNRRGNFFQAGKQVVGIGGVKDRAFSLFFPYIHNRR